MNRNQFANLVEIVETETDEEAAVKAAEKLLDTDLSDIAKATALVNAVLGKGDVGGKIGDGSSPSIATFGEHTASALSFPMAVLNLIVAAVKAESIDKFFAEKKESKDKNRGDGLGSPAGHGRASVGRNY